MRSVLNYVRRKNRLLSIICCGLVISFADGYVLAQGGDPMLLWQSGKACGRTKGDPEITLDKLAELARPALWFSRDEPLIPESGIITIPRAWKAPAGESTKEPLAYYMIRQIKAKDDELFRNTTSSWVAQKCASEAFNGYRAQDKVKHPECLANMSWNGNDIADESDKKLEGKGFSKNIADSIDTVVIRYMFYYPYDSGHVHDLESAELIVKLRKNGECTSARISEIHGSAHGF